MNIVSTTEVPAEIAQAAEKVANFFKANNLGRWELGDVADRWHHRDVIATARLCVQYRDQPTHPQLAKHLDELDNLVNL